jgi:hypothetical protein
VACRSSTSEEVDADADVVDDDDEVDETRDPVTFVVGVG